MSVAGNKKRVFITLDLNILEQLEFLAEKKELIKALWYLSGSVMNMNV